MCGPQSQHDEDDHNEPPDVKEVWDKIERHTEDLDTLALVDFTRPVKREGTVWV